MGPDVGAVVRHEDGEIADQTDAELAAFLAQRLPLDVEKELLEALLLDFRAQRAAGAIERRPIAQAQAWLPLGPRLSAAGALDRHVESEIVEPGSVARGECLKGSTIAPTLVESRECGPQVSLAKGAHRRVVDAVLREGGHIGEFARGKKAVFRQSAEIDEKRVASECAVRRIAVADGAHRKHLPPPLAGVAQPARERVRLGSESAGTMRAGQGGRVEEDTARPLAEIESHSLAP